MAYLILLISNFAVPLDVHRVGNDPRSSEWKTALDVETLEPIEILLLRPRFVVAGIVDEIVTQHIRNCSAERLFHELLRERELRVLRQTWTAAHFLAEGVFELLSSPPVERHVLQFRVDA